MTLVSSHGCQWVAHPGISCAGSQDLCERVAGEPTPGTAQPATATAPATRQAPLPAALGLAAGGLAALSRRRS